MMVTAMVRSLPELCRLMPCRGFESWVLAVALVLGRGLVGFIVGLGLVCFVKISFLA